MPSGCKHHAAIQYAWVFSQRIHGQAEKDASNHSTIMSKLPHTPGICSKSVVESAFSPTATVTVALWRHAHSTTTFFILKTNSPRSTGYNGQSETWSGQYGPPEVLD